VGYTLRTMGLVYTLRTMGLVYTLRYMRVGVHPEVHAGRCPPCGICRVWERCTPWYMPGMGAGERCTLGGMGAGERCTLVYMPAYPWWPYYPGVYTHLYHPGYTRPHPADPLRAGWVHRGAQCGLTVLWALTWNN